MRRGALNLVVNRPKSSCRRLIVALLSLLGCFYTPVEIHKCNDIIFSSPQILIIP